MNKTLVFTTCYNEHENVGPLIDEIARTVPGADILVVDDSSPDGTWTVLQEKARQHPQLTCVQRPRKLGIGSAHKYAIFYAIREGYATLVTLDADFSHKPSDIPALLAAHGPRIFVTGSRYCPGGRSDYAGYRNIVSRIGNAAARWALGVKLRELTTFFRVFDVESLKALPLRRISSDGYSYGVQLIYHIRKAGIELKEVPIHFVDRTHGASKIPRMQILWSALDLLTLALMRLHVQRDLAPDLFVADSCPNCGDRVLAMKHFGSRGHDLTPEQRSSVGAYRCTAVGRRNYPPVFVCLRCGLQQVPASAVADRLEDVYEEVVDTTYLENAAARKRTFESCFDQIQPHLPNPPGTLLEIGAYCGLFLLEARRRGWEATGVEPSRWAATYARERTGVPVHQGFLAHNRHLLLKNYDVVASWDVLEHVRAPPAFLRECGELLRPGGVLCFSTLDIDSWFPRLLRERWPWLMDMHLYYFDRGTVADMLERNGFEVLDVLPYTHFAKVGYALHGAAGMMPPVLRLGLRAIAKVLPRTWMIPVRLGDIKLYVARKA